MAWVAEGLRFRGRDSEWEKNTAWARWLNLRLPWKSSLKWRNSSLKGENKSSFKNVEWVLLGVFFGGGGFVKFHQRSEAEWQDSLQKPTNIPPSSHLKMMQVARPGWSASESFSPGREQPPIKKSGESDQLIDQLIDFPIAIFIKGHEDETAFHSPALTIESTKVLN